MKSKRDIYKGKVVSLAVEEHLLPDGRSASFEIVRHPGGAAALPVLDDGNVLLIRQFRPAIGRSVLEIPAGKLDAGEAPLDCIRRELQEETGFCAASVEKLGEMITAVGFCNEVVHLYLATNLRSVERALEPDEFIEPFPLPLDDALRMVESGEIADGKTQLALLLYARSLSKTERET